MASLVFVLALAVCAFTAAGHDSPEAIAEWAACCSQAPLAALGGRRDPWTGRIRTPSVRTFSRIFGRIVFDGGRFGGARFSGGTVRSPTDGALVAAIRQRTRSDHD